MNKIYKVMYSKVKQCAVVVSEIAKSHGHNGESSGVRKHAALTAAVLIALGSLSFTTAFVPMTAEAADKTRTPGSNFVGVERTDGLFEDSDYANYNGQGAHGADSITIGLKASGSDGTITIGDRRAEKSLGSVYIGRGPGMPTGKVLPDKTDNGYWATSVGYQSDATGYGSIAIGSNATANNSYDKDSTGHGIDLKTTSGDGKSVVLNGKPDIQRASVAIGYGASADNGNIAIGSYSDASTDLRTAKTTDGKEIKSYLTDTMADSYVSVGKTGALRRISNVADGASASDVATVGQLQALAAKSGTYKAGFGIEITPDTTTKENTIKLNRNLGTNLDKTGHVYLDVSDTGLVLGTVVDGAQGTDTDLHYGATGDYAVTVGGGVNTASGKESVVLGGSLNKASNEATVASGGYSNVASGSMAAVYGGSYNEASGADATILGGELNKASNTWTAVGGGSYNEASGKYASVWGGSSNNATDNSAAVYGGSGNSAYGSYSAILGGGSNKAGVAAVVSGGASNEAAGIESAVLGGVGNIVTGANATAVGGVKGSVNGLASVGILGGSTGINAPFTLAAGYQSTVTDTGVTSTPITEEEAEKFQEEGTHPGLIVGSNDPDNLSFKILDHFATAVGYQATADEAQTVAFGHDKGDTYYGTTTYTWKQKATVKDGHYYNEYGTEINEDDYKSLMNADGTWNDYSQPIATVEEKKYDSAYYNRLVKAADGIEDHDAVVMEQLKNASDVGSKIKVYQTDENGNIKFDKNNNPIEDTSDSDAVKTKREAAQKASEDAWGKAIGTGKIADPTKSDTNDPEANGSQQLVTGGTVYDALQKQKTELTDSLSVNAGWGIDIDKAKKNTISVKHNLGTGYADTDATGLILGGSLQNRDAAKEYGTATASSVIVGAQNALASNDNSVVVGGLDNVASGANSTVVGGDNNKASGNQSAVFGGCDNTASGIASTAGGGIMNVANGWQSTAIGGFSNYALGTGSTSVGGYGKDYATGHNSSVNGNYSVGIAGGSTGKDANYSLAAGRQAVVTTENGTAIGYQATTDEANTIAFGHDAGDVSGYTIEWEQLPNGQVNADGTGNDYTKAPTVTENKYESAAYNRLVKAADGVEDHDAVVMEQLKNASNVGQNIKVYKTDENGNVQFDESNNPIEDKSDAVKAQREAAQKASEDAWGTAIGTGKIADPNVADKETNGSQQLVTGGTVYTEVRPVTDGTYVKTKHTTAANLTALDKQVAANTTKLGDKNHNIKYYSVEDKISDDKLLPSISGYSNEKNDGAKGAGSMAAGFNTHADGIASTVAGSYSGVVGTGLQGAAALSYGTFNVNQNAAQAGLFSGVANSIVGQANVTTDSNAAIIYGAGNTVKNSYRDIDTKNASEITAAAESGDVTKLGEALQKAVPTSGGQVMVMGGGNNVESAYMSQVVGVGNTVKGNQVESKGEWVTDTPNTAIKYDPEKSSQYNYVDGFNNEVINGKHDYVIGANNKLSGDSYDDKDAQKYSNESNIVFGDNHTLTNTKNAVIIGSSDTQMILDKGDNATAIGHNASAQRDALAVGVNTEARGNAVALGTSTIAHNNSIAIGTKATAVSSQNLAIGWEAHVGNIKTDDDKIKNAVALGSDSQVKVNDLLESDNNRGVLSIGDKDKERRIIHVRAGVNDTDAVNVSQLESVQSDLTGKGLKFAANSGDEYTAKLGSTVTIQGTKKTEGHEYTADNLTTEIDENGNIKILMDKDMSVEKLAVNGKNGKDGAPGSIGISGQDGQSGIGIDGKDGISIKGRDGKDGVSMKAVDGENGTEGHIGLTGPAGTNGKDGTNAIDITVKNGYDKAGQDGKDGINGKNGVDGTSLTRIVYKDGAGEHQVATMEDGLKFKGDNSPVIAKKLNNTLDIIGGADSNNLTDKNIGVNSDGDKLKVQLSKDLTGMNSTTYTTTTGEGESATTSTTVVNGNGLTITDGPSITNKGIDSGNKVITNVGSGIETDANGKYTVTDQNKGNAANIGDVQNMVNEAVNSAADTTNKALAGKANVDASNIGANLKHADGSVASADDQKANAEKWGIAIGTGEIKADDGRMVTGKTVYEYNKPVAEVGKTLNYVSEGKTTGQNLGALDAHVKTNADNIAKNTESIKNITNNVKNLSDNAVKYDGSDKSKVTLAGKDGTTITNVKDGALSEKSSDAVNGKQLYNEQKAREDADNAITKKVTNNTNEITKIENGEGFTDAGTTVIKNLAKDAVQVKAGTAITVADNVDEKGNKTYTISANNNGTVTKDDGNLISGGTLYNEVHVDKDGTYIKSKDSATGKDMTVAQNLSALDSGLKTTSGLIHTNTAGDTIQIGGSSTATKIDVSGKDKDGKSTGRIITGVVTDATDPTSAANVGYVNGVTAANTQQIYRDMNNAYGRLNNNINKAAAGSNALAALHPLDYDPDDKADFAVGYGHYRNANAAAVGAFYHPNENTMVNVGVSLGNGDPGFNAGVSFKVGRGGAGREAMSKTEMAKVINSQSKEIDALKKDNADKDKRIDALEQKMAEILAKLDKNGK